MQEFINTFHIDWKLMIAQLINFAIVFAIFYFLAAKPLRKVMKDRGDVIEKGLDDAKLSKEILQKAAEEYEQNTIKLRKLSIDSQKELQKDLEKLKEDNLARMKADTDEWQKNRIKQMEIDKKTIIESVKSDIVSLAVLMAQKLTGKSDYKFDEKEIKELHNLFNK